MYITFNIGYKNLLLAILLLSVLFACKEGAPAPANSNLKANLMKKVWQVNKVSQLGVTTPIYQYPLPSGQSISEDYSRYRLTFTTENDYIMIEKDGTEQAGKWELAANDTKLVLDKGVSGKETIYSVIQLTSLKLIVGFAEESSKTGNRELELELVPL